MKHSWGKAILAAMMLVASVGGSVGSAVAAANSTAAPVMRDNLFKFGLKKDLELPVTVTSGGFSYTLEKIMFYDVDSKDAQALMKKYGYSSEIYRIPTKYMVWTKITIANKSNKVIQQNAKDLGGKWVIKVNGISLLAPTPGATMNISNNKEALYDWKLQPGESLTTYQMYALTENPEYLSIYTKLNGVYDEKYIVKIPGM